MLYDQIKKEFIESKKLFAKTKDDIYSIKANLLGDVKTKLLLLEKEGKTITDDIVMDILIKVKKSIKETLTHAEGHEKNKGIIQAKKELSIIEQYLPEQKSDEEVTKEVKDFIEENSLEKKDMGKIMGTFSKKLKGVFDNKKLAQIVNDLLK